MQTGTALQLHNSSYGIYFEPATNIDKNLIHTVLIRNMSQAGIFDVSSSQYVDNNNITNSTIEFAAKGLQFNYFRYGIITNNSISGITNSINLGSSTTRINITRNNITGPLQVSSSTNKFCTDIGNYYMDLAAAQTRPVQDECGPTPSISFIHVNETATNNASFSLAGNDYVNYNHPALALGNANWNGSATVQFVTGSRQFNLSKDIVFYVRNVKNTTFDCNSVIINANSTSMVYQNIRNMTIANCTIINASMAFYVVSNTTPGADYNTYKNNYIHNSSYGIYFNPDGSNDIDYNNIHTNLIRNATVAGIFFNSYYVRTTNITNNTIENAVKGLDLDWFEQGLIQNNSIQGSTNSLDMTSNSRVNVTRNNFTGALTGASSANTFCLDVGNAYLDEAAARNPGFADCGPTPYISEIRVDSANSFPARFSYGSTNIAEVNYSSLVIAAANAGNNTNIIVVNQTSNNFNGSIYMQNKYNLTIDCNRTKIIRNGITTDYGIDLRNSQGNKIRNCNISGFNSGTSTGILITATNQTAIDNVTFTTPGTYGIYANSGNTKRINITNSRFSWFTQAIWAATSTTSNDNWRIEGNYFNNNTDAIYTYTNGYMYVGNNTFYGQTDSAIDIDWPNTNESVFEFNNFTLNVYGITFTNNAILRNNFTNNTFYSYSTTSGKAVRILGTSTSGNMFWNNTFYLGVNVTSSDTGNDN